MFQKEITKYMKHKASDHFPCPTSVPWCALCRMLSATARRGASSGHSWSHRQKQANTTFCPESSKWFWWDVMLVIWPQRTHQLQVHTCAHTTFLVLCPAVKKTTQQTTPCRKAPFSCSYIRACGQLLLSCKPRPMVILWCALVAHLQWQWSTSCRTVWPTRPSRQRHGQLTNRHGGPDECCSVQETLQRCTELLHLCLSAGQVSSWTVWWVTSAWDMVCCLLCCLSKQHRRQRPTSRTDCPVSDRNIKRVSDQNGVSWLNIIVEIYLWCGPVLSAGHPSSMAASRWWS